MSEHKDSEHGTHNTHHSSHGGSGGVNVSISVKHAMAFTFVFGLVVGALGMGFLNPTQAVYQGSVGDAIRAADNPSPSPAPTPTRNNRPSRGSLKISEFMDNDPTLGSDDAPIVIIEFSDFECPFCGRHFQQTQPQLIKEYIDTGKVQFIYRDFPLTNLHAQAISAALAGECAHEQGKFFEMHDKIFANQRSMSEASYKKWAGEIGLDQAQFDGCYDSGKYNDEVQADFSDGQAAGVTGTPSFIIGTRDGSGSLVVGAQPFSVFKQTIDGLLAG